MSASFKAKCARGAIRGRGIMLIKMKNDKCPMKKCGNYIFVKGLCRNCYWKELYDSGRIKNRIPKNLKQK